jgi:hypothetical protein
MNILLWVVLFVVFIAGIGVGYFIGYRRKPKVVPFTNGKLPTWTKEKKISEIQRDFGEASVEANPYYVSNSPKAAKVFEKIKNAQGPRLSKEAELTIKEKLEAVKKAKATAAVLDEREQRLGSLAPPTESKQ